MPLLFMNYTTWVYTLHAQYNQITHESQRYFLIKGYGRRSLKAHWNGECTPQRKRLMCWVNKKPVSLLSTHSYLGMCMGVCGKERGGGVGWVVKWQTPIPHVHIEYITRMRGVDITCIYYYFEDICRFFTVFQI